MRSGRGSDAFERRFRQERQILARLQHPNIATVLDGGTTEDGEPYLVMEHVEGRPITEYCAERALGTRDRLALFRTVCGAVHYAHQNLIVHRDIKPANVLVDGQGVPKLLDFGIAKLLASGVDPDSAPTATMLPLMTPEYASPEQVKGLPVTTASDVYSLGVLLYELLAGRRPYEVRADSLEAIVRTVCETEPKAPSDFVGDRTAGRPCLRDSALAAELRGDLDTIVLKALRKEPERRYLSALELSEDLRRHLDGLPVKARADTFGYRASKFVRRHRTAVAAATLVLLSLIGGIVTTIRQARIAEANRQRAERRFADVRDLATSFLFDIHDEIRELPGSTQVRQQLVETAQEYLDDLAREAAGDMGLERDLAAAYERLGDVQGGALSANLGDMTAALESYGKAAAIRESLASAGAPGARDSIDLARLELRRATLLRGMGRLADAEPIFRRVAERIEAAVAAGEAPEDARRSVAVAYAGWASVQTALGRTEEARHPLERAIEHGEAFAREHPEDAAAQASLANSYYNASLDAGNRGAEQEALELVRRARAIQERLRSQNPLDQSSCAACSSASTARACTCAASGSTERPSRSIDTPSTSRGRCSVATRRTAGLRPPSPLPMALSERAWSSGRAGRRSRGPAQRARIGARLVAKIRRTASFERAGGPRHQHRLRAARDAVAGSASGGLPGRRSQHRELAATEGPGTLTGNSATGMQRLETEMVRCRGASTQ